MKKRRVERELERSEREKEQEMMQREKEAVYFKQWECQEDSVRLLCNIVVYLHTHPFCDLHSLSSLYSFTCSRQS